MNTNINNKPIRGYKEKVSKTLLVVQNKQRSTKLLNKSVNKKRLDFRLKYKWHLFLKWDKVSLNKECVDNIPIDNRSMYRPFITQMEKHMLRELWLSNNKKAKQYLSETKLIEITDIFNKNTEDVTYVLEWFPNTEFIDADFNLNNYELKE